jgi:hypothetical protein
LPRAAIILLADTETPEGMGRTANALTTAKELKEAGDDAVVVFDRAGTRWAAELVDAEHKDHRLFEDVRDHVPGACVSCARAYGVKDAGEQAGIPLLDDFKGHPSVRNLIADRYQVVTF